MRSPGVFNIQRRAARIIGCLVALAGGLAGSAEPETPPVELLRLHCGGCHCDGGVEGGIDLDALLSGAAAGPPAEQSDEQKSWVAVWRNLQAETMPPADEERPTPDERQTLVSFVLGNVLGVDPQRPDPGHVVLRRLNRVEYGNTIRDLTGFRENVTDDLPPDDTGYGFDTIGDVLSLSPLLLEKYLDIAGHVADQVVAEATAGRTTTGYEGPASRLFTMGLPPQEPAARPAHRRSTLRSITDRAYRRPVDDTTLDRLAAVAEAVETSTGGSFEAGVGAALTAILASPRFLFRFEESDPTAVSAGPGYVETRERIYGGFTELLRVGYALRRQNEPDLPEPLESSYAAATGMSAEMVILSVLSGTKVDVEAMTNDAVTFTLAILQAQPVAADA